MSNNSSKTDYLIQTIICLKKKKVIIILNEIKLYSAKCKKKRSLMMHN